MQEVLASPCEIHCISLPTPFPVGDVNVHLVKSEKLTLVDAGVKTIEAWNHFKNELAKLGYTPEDIDQVVITHHHPDHVGMLDYLSPELPVYGHRFNQPWITKNSSFFEHHDQFFYDLFSKLGVDGIILQKMNKLRKTLAYSCERSLSYEVKEGDTIPGLPGWTVLETPGHAQSHIALYHEGSRVLLGGDLLLGHISSNPLLEPPMDGEERPKTLLQYNESLRIIRDLQVKKVYPGHGNVIENASALITERLHKQEKRAEIVVDMLKEEPLTALQVCQKLFPLVYKKELVLTLSETLGQLDYLMEDDYIKMETVDGQWVFKTR
ncbi:glyoxylase-like metal-dependent hydrolase (beta-lactamase superfamily II) [Bacillus mesophilus]|uniref:MBL fold metallo-hydrolase n=1 Tax=Bacillus mesophilus TaxID=1808955 RepID=A0A6M0Q515_9BACI|nr:MBL fold metallo-hydrolase [Bacillus mesophilus]MBM7660981.1 glyoxylase-like metal-dependent hydrolase (beta-lactamase superfamily II) [Bacillus mesophilus]NEY71477.1 MBL fold metallo-hydrolase [Bacillus mesophilus]